MRIYVVYFLLGISPESNCSWPTFRNPVSVPSSKAVHLAFEDGTDTGFRNVGQPQFDAGEIPRRKYTINWELIQGFELWFCEALWLRNPLYSITLRERIIGSRSFEQRSVLTYKSRYVIEENHRLTQAASYPRRTQSSIKIFNFR